jgi:serine/threonine-protein kinase RsbT
MRDPTEAAPDATIDETLVVSVASDADVVTARSEGRALAERLGFSGADLTLVATAISEVARNITTYAGPGEIQLYALTRRGVRGIGVVAIDEGPGITDIDAAMADGYTTGAGMGLGLPGARRLMDEFDVWSEVGVGTRVTMRKWCDG